MSEVESELNDDDVEKLMEELMHKADTQPDLDLSWLKMTTKEKHNAEYDRLTKKQKEHDEKLRRLTQEANEMLAKHKANESNPNEEPDDISDDDLKKMMAEYDEHVDAADKGGKTRHKRSGHKRKQNGYSKKRTYRKKSMNKKKRTCRKNSMNKKKRTYRKKRT